MTNSISAIIIAFLFILGVHFFYYPKWEQPKTEATLSWDVSGYYLYLPAAFIYSDLKQCEFAPDILDKYTPTFDFQQAFKHKASGNYVMKYSLGQAVLMSPAFFAAHVWASNSLSYEADGFSHPYQFMISMWSLLVSIIRQLTEP